MASTSERQVGLERVRAGYHAWALALLLCPLSYICLTLLHYLPISGLLVTVLVAVFALSFALSTRDGHAETSLWHGALIAGVLGALVWIFAAAFEQADGFAAAAAGLALVGQLLFFWVFYTWVTLELAGASVELGETPAAHARGPSRASLSFLLFLCLLVFGLGAAWSRGDTRTPDPAVWMVAEVLLILGVMFFERLGFFERSAYEGNLVFTRDSHRVWAVGALLLVLLAAALALLGPHRAASPQVTSRSGNAITDEAGPAAPSQPIEDQLRDSLSAFAAAAGGAAQDMPRHAFVLWLLLLLLLLAVVLVWVFHRSRAARWVLWLVAWLLSRLLRLWQRLLAALRRLVTPAPAPAPQAPVPPWVQDPLLDVFEHPELLAGLSPRELAIRVFHLLLNVGDMLGYSRRREQTPLEYSRSFALPGPAQAALRTLTWSYLGAMYGGTETTLPLADDLRGAWREVLAALTGPLSPEDLAARREAYRQRVAGLSVVSPRPA